MTTSLIHGNALTIPLRDQSVHLIVTSPPYFSLRSYQDNGSHFDDQLGSEATPLHFLVALWQVMDECWRVLRDDGSAWINLGDKYTGSGGHNNSGLNTDAYWRGHNWDETRNAPKSYNKEASGIRDKSRMLLPHRFAEGLIDPEYREFVHKRAGVALTADPPQWICRMDCVWYKKNSLPESVQDRVRASHEYWFHFTKQGDYYAAMDEIREEHTGTTSPQAPRPMLSGNGLTHRQGGTDGAALNPLGKPPGSVWHVATEPLRPPAYAVFPRHDSLVPTRYLVDDRQAWQWVDVHPEHLSCAWPREAEVGAQLHCFPAHFAAFPSTFPAMIVKGWSPSGVCTRCGEGRRPVCEAEYEHVNHTAHTKSRAGNAITSASRTQASAVVARKQVTITGTACACPTPDAPTTPARVLDPFSGTGTTSIVASALGRHGIGVDLSWDYHRIAAWRRDDPTTRHKALGLKPPAKKRVRPGEEPSTLFDSLL